MNPVRRRIHSRTNTVRRWLASRRAEQRSICNSARGGCGVAGYYSIGIARDGPSNNGNIRCGERHRAGERGGFIPEIGQSPNPSFSSVYFWSKATAVARSAAWQISLPPPTTMATQPSEISHCIQHLSGKCRGELATHCLRLRAWGCKQNSACSAVWVVSPRSQLTLLSTLSPRTLIESYI